MGAAALEMTKTAEPTLARRPKKRLKTAFRFIHLWVGLSFGLILVAQGLSGAALVWRPELDRLMLGSIARVKPSAQGTSVSLDAQLAAANAVATGARVRALRLPASQNLANEWMAQFPAAEGAKGDGPRWTIYTSPTTGQVTGIRGQKRDTLQFLIELHHNLFWGKTGRAIQGYVAMGTIILAITGIILWWPKQWTSSRFQPRAAAKPLHYALGFWFMWPLLLIAVTAIYFVWRQPIQRAFGVAEKQGPGARQQGASQPDEHRGGGVGGRHHGATGDREHAAGDSRERQAADSSQRSPQPVSLDAIVAAAHAIKPDARLTMVRFPEGKGAYTVMFEAADENYRAAPNSISIRALPDGSARVEKVSLWRDLPRAKRFLEWMPRLHQGEFGGVIIRAVWCMTGFVPAMLYVSGFLMWRRRIAKVG